MYLRKEIHVHVHVHVVPASMLLKPAVVTLIFRLFIIQLYMAIGIIIYVYTCIHESSRLEHTRKRKGKGKKEKGKGEKKEP